MALPSEAQNARNVRILSGAGRVTTHCFEFMFPTLAVCIAGQTGVPLTQVLGWGFLGYLLFGFGALPAGLLTDYFGYRPLLLIGLFGLGVGALAAGEAPNGRVLSFCLALMGGCASIPRPAAIGLLSHSADRRHAARAGRIAAGATIVLTPFVTATLATHFGWQSTCRVLGYLLCAAAVACGFLHVDERRPAAPPASTTAPLRRAALLPFAVLLATAALAALSYRGTTLVQPGYFAARVSASRFGLVTSLVYLFGVSGQYVGGRLADGWHPGRLSLVFHALSLPALLLMAALTGLPLIGVAAVFAFFSFGVRPIEAGLVARYAPSRWRATAYGGLLAFTSGIGALAVWLVEWAGAAGGLSYALLYLAGVVALVVGAAAALVRVGEPEWSDLVRSASIEVPGGRRFAGTVLDASTAPAKRRPPEHSGVPW